MSGGNLGAALLRLDLWLQAHKGVSRTVAKSWITAGRVTVNGALGKPALTIRDTDVVVVNDAADADAKSKNALPALVVVYEDDDVLVINKPAGLTVHPGSGVRGRTLVESLQEHTESLSIAGGEERPGIVHRLDKDTQGLMIIAKTDEAHAGLKAQFQERTIIKKYAARVSGVIAKDNVEIDLPIGRHRNHRTLMTTAPSAILSPKPAQTLVKVIHRWTNQTLIEARPITGRTHQIRVHLAAIGHPVIGDTFYNKKAGHTGLCLQAVYLEFKHPVTGKTLSFSLPVLPDIGRNEMV